jgi:NADH-quinone oxidoreductase subunit I
MNIIRGFRTTFKHLLEEPVTLQYPEQMVAFKDRYKGRHHLRRYENGLEKCIGCALCAAACPADAIWVEAAENSEDACPTQAIELGHEHQLSFTDRRDSIFTKEMLIDPVPPGGKPTPQKVEPGVYTRAIPDMPDPK